MTQYSPRKISLSEGQKKSISKAVSEKEAVKIRFTHGALSGADTLFLTNTQLKKLEKAQKEKTGAQITLSKTQLRKNKTLFGKGMQLHPVGFSPPVVQPLPKSMLKGGYFPRDPPPIVGSWDDVHGGSLGSLIATFGLPLLKKLGIAGATGLLNAGAEKLAKKIFGSGAQTGGFIVPIQNLETLASRGYNYFSPLQQKDLHYAMQTGSGMPIFLNREQRGGFLGALLASIGVPIALDLVKKLVGRGGKKK